MSTRKARNQKSNRKRLKSGKDTDEAKIFVLAPNILEKLGINLGTKTNENHSKEHLPESCHSSLPGVKHNSLTQKNRKYNKSESNEVSTSLSETATLMKNSVLLSPTFSHNAVDGTLSKDFENTLNVEVIDTYLNGAYTQSEAEMITISKNTNAPELNDAHSTPTHDELIIPSDIVNTKTEENQNTNQDNQLNLLTDETGSISDFVFKVPYPQTINVTGSEVAFNTIEQNKNKGLINNFIIPHTQLNNVKTKTVLSTATPNKEIVKLPESRNKALIDPTIICAKDSKCFSNKELQQDTSCKDSIEEAIKGIDKNCKMLTDNNGKTEYQLNNSSVVGVATIPPTQKSGEKSEKIIEDQNPSVISNVSNWIATDKDKVKEIANYLSKYARKTTLHTKRTKVMSKSTIQGVEKPGGELEVNKSGGQTYIRKNKHAAQKDVGMRFNYTEINPGPQSENIDYVGLPTILNDQVYCICYDFGTFINLEENIHFCNQSSLHLQKEVLYEIYNEEVEKSYSKSLDKESDSFIDITELDQSDVLTPICWNIFGSKENNLNDKMIAYLANPNDDDNFETSKNIKPSLNVVKNNTSLESKETEKTEHACYVDVKNTDETNRALNANVIPKPQEKNREECLKLEKVPKKSENMLKLEKSFSTKLNTKEEVCPESVSHTKHVTKNDFSLNMRKEMFASIKKNLTCLTNQSRASVAVPLSGKNSQKLDEKDMKINSKPHKGSSTKNKNSSVVSETNIEKAGMKRKKSFDNVVPNKKPLKNAVLLSENEWNMYNNEEVHCSQDVGSRNDTNSANETVVTDEDEQSLSELKHLQDKINKIDDYYRNPTVKCGVCSIETSDWIDHISKEHQYIAWKDGEEPLECYDENDARFILQNVLREVGELVCYKCGLVRKQARAYLKHMKACDENISFNISIVSDINNSQVLDTSLFHKCGVCAAEVKSDDWVEHITKEHEYIAWKEDEEPLDLNNEEQIRLHLLSISKHLGGLTCSKCGMVRKFAKNYLNHVKDCTGEMVTDVSSISNISTIVNESIANIEETPSVYKCGVCSKEIDCKNWIEHINKEHEYIAWKEGDKSLNIEDKDQIREHLHNLSKMTGGLMCSKCGIIRKYVKSYITHIESCTGEANHEMKQNNGNDSDSDDNLPEEVKCGVCKMEMKREDWISHIEENHNYLAWWDTEEPLDLNNEKEVNEHLKQICYSNGGLKCTKCDFFIKRVPKRYLAHIKTDCTVYETSYHYVKENKSGGHKVKREKGELLECARCHKKVTEAEWSDHAMTEHYNVAWPVGDAPINIRNQYSVEKHLKEYFRKYNSYRCKVCGITRVSCYGFYAHIIVCGRSDEETKIFKEHCKICNEMYLCVYRSQHMTAHKESELTKRRRQEMRERNKQAVLIEQIEPEVVSGKRRAAQKAISVIGNISKDENIDKTADFSDTDESVELDLDEMESDDSESDVDSNISDQEHEQRILASTEKSQRNNNDTIGEYAKSLPFDVPDKRAFIIKGVKDFAKMYFTEGVIFPKWRPCAIEVLDEEKISKYLPKLEKSCLIHYEDDVMSMKRFETTKGHNKASFIFTGGAIRQVCWVPVTANDSCDSYLTVVCHNGGDVPKHNDDEIVSGPGSIQIWNCENFNKLATLSMVWLHDYGVVWSLSWCPSGARDHVLDSQLDEQNNLRLGLVAAACSNGLAYIFSVPYPASNNKNIFTKLKPVAELRMTSNEERRMYQATSISWSRDKGHDTILVGYSDGTMCYYNISSSSPITTSNENGLDVFYPYNEIKAHNGCITGVGLFPGARGGGVVCSGSLLGGALRPGAGAGAGAGAARRSNYPVDNIFMSHHWPAAYVAGDTSILNALAPNDIEFWGLTRRLGLVHAMAECKCCGLVATCTTSQIRVMRPYPASVEISKMSLLSIDVKHLAKKRKIKSDELGVVVEPLTYGEAIQKYGLNIKHFHPKSDVPVQLKPLEVCIERFPLNAVNSMDFCSSSVYHNKLAVGMHAGVVVILNVM